MIPVMKLMKTGFSFASAPDDLSKVASASKLDITYINRDYASWGYKHFHI